MRFRPWLTLSGLVAILALTALPAAGQGTGFDQVQILSHMANGLPEPVDHNRQWLEFGVALPVTTFDDRGWDPGLLVRWSQEVWTEGPVGLVGSVGLGFNDNSRFNEAQVDQAFETPLDSASLSAVSVLRHQHVLLPMAIELQFEPTRMSDFSPFLAGGPAIQYTHETITRERWYAVSYPNFTSFAVPISTYSPSAPGLVADRYVDKTHFHVGYQARAGFRANIGTKGHPLHMRLTASLNTWFEHDRPVSLVGGALSFGR